ncbi:hypothetical protein PsYK624_119610 [Phanerochaete sordida]|uniref:Uncharacterized protein n=1 Tax=Phanerochaete sordida TaxID=48140 RepID=A0A9P3GK60_9APHY|nr:hypothetical protein PsYK624_119610 [Phanerochaete sordida]
MLATPPRTPPMIPPALLFPLEDEGEAEGCALADEDVEDVAPVEEALDDIALDEDELDKIEDVELDGEESPAAVISVLFCCQDRCSSWYRGGKHHASNHARRTG